MEFVAIDILGLLPRTLDGNQLVQVMTDRFPKLTRVVSRSRTALSRLASLSMDDRIIPYDIPTDALKDNGAQFISSLFKWL